MIHNYYNQIVWIYLQIKDLFKLLIFISYLSDDDDFECANDFCNKYLNIDRLILRSSICLKNRSNDRHIKKVALFHFSP